MLVGEHCKYHGWHCVQRCSLKSTCSMALIGLTHWGRATHICVGNLTILVSDNGLSPGRRQAIIWTNAGILLIRTLGTNFSEILGEIHSFSFSKMHLKMSSAKWRLFGRGLNELKSLYRPTADSCLNITQHVLSHSQRSEDFSNQFEIGHVSRQHCSHLNTQSRGFGSLWHHIRRINGHW